MMFTLEERHGKLYAMYDFTSDELNWLLEWIPHNDELAEDAKRIINELKQAEFGGRQIA